MQMGFPPLLSNSGAPLAVCAPVMRIALDGWNPVARSRFIVFGSFVTAKPEPNDLDLFQLMDDLVTHAPVKDPVFDLFREAFRELGYEDGQNLSLRIVSAEGQLDQLPALASDLIRQGVDVIIAPNDVSNGPLSGRQPESRS